MKHKGLVRLIEFTKLPPHMFAHEADFVAAVYIGHPGGHLPGLAEHVLHIRDSGCKMSRHGQIRLE